MSALLRPAPLLFVSHGAPSFALQTQSKAATNLQMQGKQLTGCKAIIAISPHWSTASLYINNAAQPKIVHDFYGFAPALYQLDYPAMGSTEDANMIASTLRLAGIESQFDTHAAWDHGVWIPMRFLRPNGDIPVIHLSYPASWDLSQLAALGKALATLRAHGFALLMSGAMSHNFADLNPKQSGSADYVERLRAKLFTLASNKTLPQLDELIKNDADFKRAHPTFEHFAPFYIALAATQTHDKAYVYQADVDYHALAMDSISWLAQEA